LSDAVPQNFRLPIASPERGRLQPQRNECSFANSLFEAVPKRRSTVPLLEVVQTKQISASIRLTDTTATQVDQYAAFIHASADDVVEQALSYVFSKDRAFQDFLKTPQASHVASTLRIRKAPAAESAAPVAQKLASASIPASSSQSKSA
jgi:hypothetical protein